jgi:hypothetical protein
MHVTAAEPFLPDTLSERLESLAIELSLAAGQFSGRLAPRVRLAVGELVRSMNCYYSNLIEGHDTHPHDIDRALIAGYSANPKKRALQLGTLSTGAHRLMRAALEHGEVPRADVPAIVQASERTGQRATKSLLENGYLHGEGHTSPLLFAIPPAARDRWFPSLYPNLPAATT